MKREDWTLLVIAAAKRPGLSPVQLQKSLFLLGEELDPAELGDSFYEFAPYNYGPFDVAVYQDAERLADEGLVAITRTAERRWALYESTGDGAAKAKSLRTEASSHAVEYLDRVVAWVQRLSFHDLVRAIYAQFPEYRANSVFQG
jgi:hypothetical protein